jgi:hypothetical protein
MKLIEVKEDMSGGTYGIQGVHKKAHKILI